MITAKEKKKSNIIEYVLYMWQLEDLLRACKFDETTIKTSLVGTFKQPPEVLAQIEDWYMNLAETMRIEHVMEKGHLQVVSNTVSDIYDMHLRLLDAPEQIEYQNKYRETVPYIKEFTSKLQNKPQNEIDVCFTALYGVVLLRLQKKEISEGTMAAIGKFTQLLSQLGTKYHERESGKLEI